jgi:hypothetical protein
MIFMYNTKENHSDNYLHIAFIHVICSTLPILCFGFIHHDILTIIQDF